MRHLRFLRALALMWDWSDPCPPSCFPDYVTVVEIRETISDSWHVYCILPLGGGRVNIPSFYPQAFFRVGWAFGNPLTR